MPQEASITGETILFFDELYDAMNGLDKDDKKKASRSLMTDNSSHLRIMEEAKAKLNRMRFVNKETLEPDP